MCDTLAGSGYSVNWSVDICLLNCRGLHHCERIGVRSLVRPVNMRRAADRTYGGDHVNMLTPAAAKELGRGLRFMRHGRNLTLRDVAKRSELSAQYVQNIERGERLNASDESFEKLARGYEVPFEVVADLLLKARIVAALEQRGLTPDQQTFVWRGIEQRLSEQGLDIKTDVAAVVANMLR